MLAVRRRCKVRERDACPEQPERPSTREEEGIARQALFGGAGRRIRDLLILAP
jgi:hypothetical protein